MPAPAGVWIFAFPQGEGKDTTTASRRGRENATSSTFPCAISHLMADEVRESGRGGSGTLLGLCRRLAPTLFLRAGLASSRSRFLASFCDNTDLQKEATASQNLWLRSMAVITLQSERSLSISCVRTRRSLFHAGQNYSV